MAKRIVLTLFLFSQAALCLLATDSTVNVVPGTGGDIIGCLTYGNGRPATGVPVTFSLGARGTPSGYHYHSSGTAPNITLYSTTGVTGGDGCARANCLVPYFAGVYVVYFSGGGVVARVTVNAMTGGMQALTSAIGIAPLSTFQDSGHNNLHLYGEPNMNIGIHGIGGSWYNSGYATLLGGMALIRMSIPWGGDLDVSPPGSWTPNSDPHPSGYDFDMKNPSTTNTPARTAMLNAISGICGAGETFPIGGGTLQSAYSWHVTCY